MNKPGSSFSQLCDQYKSSLATQQLLDNSIAYLERKTSQLSQDQGFSHTAETAATGRRLAELRRRSLGCSRRLDTLSREITRLTHTLPQERLGVILRLRYIEQMGWSEISDLTGIELRWLMRLHRRALSQLSDRAG